MIYARLLCLLDRHHPDRNRVRWDGFGYAGHCTRCAAPIRRLRKSRWSSHIVPQPTSRIGTTPAATAIEQQPPGQPGFSGPA